MIKYVCDKCGKEYAIFPEQQCVLPKYSIYVTCTFSFIHQEVNLCSDCEKKLDYWLNKKD